MKPLFLSPDWCRRARWRQGTVSAELPQLKLVNAYPNSSSNGPCG